MFRVVFLLALSSAAAQDTGGSFGGGDFGGGDFGGGDYSGGDYGGGGDYGSSDFGSGDYSGGGGSDHGSLVALGSFAFVALLVGSLEARRRWPTFFRARQKKKAKERRREARATAPVDVSAISLAIDWRARAELQARLAELAHSGDTRSMGGLAKLLHETVTALRRLEHAWLYAGALNATQSRPDLAEQTFRNAASEMRSRFKRELVRGHGGTVRTDEPGELRAKREEGPGVVVVTVIVAARGEIPDIAHAADAEHLRKLMRAFGAIGARRLVALEVIWSPAAENDRMSTAELEVLYPELHRIDSRSMAGRVFCGYCAFPYPGELLECPHCGAPSRPAG